MGAGGGGGKGWSEKEVLIDVELQAGKRTHQRWDIISSSDNLSFEIFSCETVLRREAASTDYFVLPSVRLSKVTFHRTFSTYIYVCICIVPSENSNVKAILEVWVRDRRRGIKKERDITKKRDREWDGANEKTKKLTCGYIVKKNHQVQKDLVMRNHSAGGTEHYACVTCVTKPCRWVRMEVVYRDATAFKNWIGKP